MYMGTILVSGNKATLLYSESIVDNAALSAAVAAGDMDAAKRIMASAKVENRTRTHVGDCSAESLTAFAKATVKADCAVAPTVAGSNVWVVSASHASPASQKKGK